MDKGQPWSVKGIAPDTRQAAKMAARRAGLTVGAWLNHAILKTAAEEAEGSGQRPSAALAQPSPLSPQMPTQPQSQSPQPMPPGTFPPGGYPAGGYPPQSFPPQPYPTGAYPPGTYPGQTYAAPYYGQADIRAQASHGSNLPAQSVDVLLEAMRRQTEEIKTTVREAATDIRAGTDRLQPLAERLRPIGEQIAEIAQRLNLVADVDRRMNEAERKAEHVSLQVKPLERTLARLSERLEGDSHMPYPDPEGRYRRRGLFGKLFGE